MRMLMLFVLCALGSANGAYYGKLIQSGWGAGASNQLAGMIYSVDKNTFQVRGFAFQLPGQDSMFLMGTTGKKYSDVKAGGIDTDAVEILNPLGQTTALKSYDGETVMLKLPSRKVLTDYTYIAVGNRTSKQLYGGADIPTGFEVPAPKSVGSFSTKAHGVGSGEVTIINDRVIEIKALRYDGQGPDAYFYVGVTATVVPQSKPYGIIPDENGVSNRKARAYSDRDIMLVLPSGISATDLSWLSIYCVSYAHNFGEVFFPKNLNVPPYAEVDIDRGNLNCEPMSENLQVSWIVANDTITIELAGNIDRNKDYMSFGLSGDPSRFLMKDADVVVADFKENREPRAIDYFLTAYSQCADNGGACPDTSTFNNATDDVLSTYAQVTNGITRIKYSRALTTTDSTKDRPFKADGTLQQIVWAIGPLNSNDEAAKHYPGARISENMAINFTREIKDNCKPFKPAIKVTKPDFKPHHLYGKDGATFTAEIGQAASEQGYLALTDQPSWGIAWYINGILVPELHLKRGVSYTFRVGGGTNQDAGAKYHPLYFTDNVEGGFQQTNNGTIYKGAVKGKPSDYAVGGYCEWKLTAHAVSEADKGKVYDCFEAFKDDLYLDCDANSDDYAEFVFTPGPDTPKLLYYQCYTHKNLGWKVHIHDKLPLTEQVTEDCRSSGVVFTASLLSLVMSGLLRHI